MKSRLIAFSGIVALSTTLVAGCGANQNAANNGAGGGNPRTGATTLSFLQNKPEVVTEWNKLIAEFQRQNPDIQVKQINPPNTDTVLQADVSKGQVPDIIAMGADATFIQLARNGVFKDLSGSSQLGKVSPAYTQMLESEVGSNTPYALPFTVNAVPVIYNVTLFNKYHLKVPTTWDQFMAEARQVRSAGGTPFYNGFKDAWTMAVSWNPLAANETGQSFFQQIRAGKASFSQNLRTSASRMQQFTALGQPNQFGVSYNDANTGFANGKSVFYVQGIWTLPVIRQANPNIKLSTFVFPATNNASQTRVVSGVDSLLTIANSGDAARQTAAMKFVSFLLQPKNAGEYANIAGLFSTVKGVRNTDPALAPLQSSINRGRVVDFPDHYYPPAMAAGNQYESVLQGALSKRQGASALLQQLDNLYRQSAAHQ